MNGWRLESRRKGDLSGESEEGRPRGESGIDGGWGVGGRETSAESHEWVKAGESEEGRPQQRVRNGWRLGSRRKRVLSGESGMGGGWGVGMGGGWRVRNGDLSVESGMGKGWGVGGRETSAECQEWVEAGESEEGRPQRRVRNG
ncbi:hypothetical protein NDU88_003717 [Pleurodeles waltl]|uniref:Uncharacterized protein n=1 Tax=Pleurodeles waltl TaxID=8319 RepID=A0AAV7KY70_PLEWA|nr:hypothetical protein NDU88_003717 [Pleurodeles waltl]